MPMIMPTGPCNSCSFNVPAQKGTGNSVSGHPSPANAFVNVWYILYPWQIWCSAQGRTKISIIRHCRWSLLWLSCECLCTGPIDLLAGVVVCRRPRSARRQLPLDYWTYSRCHYFCICLIKHAPALTPEVLPTATADATKIQIAHWRSTPQPASALWSIEI